MTKGITYSKLKRFLKGFGYEEKILSEGHAVFTCGDPKTLLIYRAYRPDEVLDWNDVAKTRKFLDAWGFVEENEFDDRLRDTAA
jgi:hypothetical protein